MRKFYPLLGVAGPVIYIITVFIGGALRSDYSQISNTISELTVTGSANLLLMNIMFLIYNFCMIFLGFGAFKDINPVKNRSYRVATFMIGTIGILGAILIFFPQDPRGATVTLAGNIHILIAGILSILTILSVLLVGVGLRVVDGWKKFVWYSYITCTVIIVSGGIAGYTVATNSIYGGLAERITIFAFMVWVLVFSILLITRTPSECHLYKNKK